MVRMRFSGASSDQGALQAAAREIVASASRRFIIVADKSKEVARLGAFPLPVEVIPMAEPLVERQLIKLDSGRRYDGGKMVRSTHG